MRPTGYRRACAPSPPLLHFLRSQIEELCFSPTAVSSSYFTPSKPRYVSWSANAKQRWPRSKKDAPLEASILNLGHLLVPNHFNISRYKKIVDNVIRCHFQGVVCQRRCASNDPKPFLKRLTEYRSKTQERAALGRNDMPALIGDSSGTVFGRSKATNELKLRCTEFDENGNVTLVNGEFKKSELMTKVDDL